MGFRMVVADVFRIAGRGVVVTGRLESGVVSADSRVVVERDGQPIQSATVGAVELGSARARPAEAQPGDKVGLLLRDVQDDDVARGDQVVM